VIEREKIFHALTALPLRSAETGLDGKIFRSDGFRYKQILLYRVNRILGITHDVRFLSVALMHMETEAGTAKYK
jgi:hypothetical protein